MEPDVRRRQLVGDSDPEMAPLLLSYGKALYELAFAQQGVMGKEELGKQADDAGELVILSSSLGIHAEGLRRASSCTRGWRECGV